MQINRQQFRKISIKGDKCVVFTHCALVDLAGQVFFTNIGVHRPWTYKTSLQVHGHNCLQAFSLIHMSATMQECRGVSVCVV